MNILVAIPLYLNGSLNSGYSYEYYNIYLPLKELGQEVHLFAFDSECAQRGRVGMNDAFRALIADRSPDVVLVVPIADEFRPDTITAAGRICPTVAYFQDDIWRVAYSQYWARYYSYVISTDPNGEAKFRAAGLNNVVYSPRGCNAQIYRPNSHVARDIAVSFVGLYAPYRGWLIARLRHAGIDVETFGSGWPTAKFFSNIEARARNKLRSAGLPVSLPPEGQIAQDQMIQIFQRTKVNLNLPNSICWDMRYLASSPLAVANTIFSKKVRDGIKGRHFEINGCGGFQLTYYAEGLEKCYSIGEELAIFMDPEELVEKTRYYLGHDVERDAIAARGLIRTQQDHSIVRRLAEALRQIKLSATPEPISHG